MVKILYPELYIETIPDSLKNKILTVWSLYKSERKSMNNPLLQQWKTPFNTPPFNLIETAHFQPAIVEAIRIAEKEIELISECIDAPTFVNTIAALDNTGVLIGRITSILFNLNSAETNKDLQAVTQEVSPLLTRFSNDITLNRQLFERIKYIFESNGCS